jgi:hypothetical protein
MIYHTLIAVRALYYQEGDSIEGSRFDLELACVYENKKTCHGCEETIDDDDYHDVGGDYFCNECYGDRYTSCDRCGDGVENHDVMSVNHNQYEGLCESCYSYLGFSPCDECGEHVRELTRANDNGLDYCEFCASRYLTECEYCHESYYSECDNNCQEETEETTEEV